MHLPSYLGKLHYADFQRLYFAILRVKFTILTLHISPGKHENLRALETVAFFDVKHSPTLPIRHCAWFKWQLVGCRVFLCGIPDIKGSCFISSVKLHVVYLLACHRSGWAKIWVIYCCSAIASKDFNEFQFYCWGTWGLKNSGEIELRICCGNGR